MISSTALVQPTGVRAATDMGKGEGRKAFRRHCQGWVGGRTLGPYAEA